MLGLYEDSGRLHGGTKEATIDAAVRDPVQLPGRAGGMLDLLVRDNGAYEATGLVWTV